MLKISSVNRPHQVQNTSLIKNSTASHDFSESMEMAKRDHDKKWLIEKLKKVNKLGEELKDKPDLQRITEYKKQIKEYLSFVLKHYYKVSYNQSMYSTHLLSRVEVINKKIEELTNDFLHQQKDTLDIIKRIDTISGLLIDLIL
jgi:uncharacterized protein YaaR (DUF327 family)